MLKEETANWECLKKDEYSNIKIFKTIIASNKPSQKDGDLEDCINNIFGNNDNTENDSEVIE